MSHLWEVDHSYYCSESNYYSNEPGETYESWQDFDSEWSGNDLDMNMVFRWDWTIYCGDDDDGLGRGCEHDDYYRCGTLWLFYMLQRKGIFLCNQIKVCRADEADVRAFLAPRWTYIQELWLPVAPSNESVGEE